MRTKTRIKLGVQLATKRPSARNQQLDRRATPDETALERMRGMLEAQFREDVVTPLLGSIGSHVQETHGAREEGKDFTYVYRDHIDEPVLAVCQVKNDKFSGNSSSSNNVTTVLRQLIQCVDLEILNPVTNIRERPQSVSLLTAYALPDDKTKAAGALLQEIREKRIQVIGPDKLLHLLKKHAPQLYSSLAYPGQEVHRVLAEYVSQHREASAFNLPAVRSLHEFFVDLDVAVGQTSPSHQKPISFRYPIRIPIRQFDQILAFISALPLELDAVEIAEGEAIRKSADFMLQHINPQAFVDRVQAQAEQLMVDGGKGAALQLLSQAATFLEFLSEVLLEAGEWNWEGTWPSLGAPVDSVAPSALVEPSDSLALVAEVGSGKTSLARSVASEALAMGIPCVYFPCFMIQPNLNLRENIEGFIAGLSPGTTRDAIAQYVSSAKIVIIDGMDEAPRYGSELPEEIGFLFRELAGESLQTQVAEKASAFSVPLDLEATIGVTRLDENESLVATAYPLRGLDFERLALGNPAVAGAIREWASRYRAGAPLIMLTTRDDSMFEFPGRLTRLTLSPFTDEQLEAFLSAWFSREDQLQPLLQFMQDNPHIREACRRPMIATLLAGMHASGVNLPRSRSELYERRFELLLERWDRAKGLKRSFVVTPRDKLSLLSRLALNMHIDNRRTFSSQEFISLWADGLNAVYEDVEPDDLLEELRVANGVVTRIGSDAYSLGHLSFQEYLAANGALQAQQESLLVANFYENWWREVLVFYSGLRGDISSMLERIQRTTSLRSNHGLLEELIDEARFTTQTVRDFLNDAEALLDDDDDPDLDPDTLVAIDEIMLRYREDD